MARRRTPATPLTAQIPTAPAFPIAFTLAFIAFKLLHITTGIRASDLEQDEGLDFHEHSASAYPEFRTADQ